MDEWREGTIVENDSEQVNIENVMRDIEKTLDLDSFGQVQRSKLGPSIAGTSQQHSQETSTPATGISKGKEVETNIQATKQSTMSKQPEISKEQAQCTLLPLKAMWENIQSCKLL